MSEQEKYNEEELKLVIDRLRVCQLGGVRIMGLVPKGEENNETKVLENAVGVTLRVTQMGAMPVTTSIDFCALPVKRYRIGELTGEYWVSELHEQDAKTYASLYLDTVSDLIRQKDGADQNQVVPANPQAMAILNQLASGGQLKPGAKFAPGAGILPGR